MHLIYNCAPLLSQLPIPIRHPLCHSLPQTPTNPHSQKVISMIVIATIHGRLDHLCKQSTPRIVCCYQCLYHIEAPPPPPLSSTPINRIDRPSVSASVSRFVTRYPQGLPSCHPLGALCCLPAAATLDYQQHRRYSLLPHMRVASLPGVTRCSSPQASRVPVKRDG